MNCVLKWLFSCTAIVILVPCIAYADNDVHPVVPGFERFIEVEEITDVQRGMLLFNELNCASCHPGSTTWSADPKQAPILSDVGTRVLPEYFETFLLSPHDAKPGTSMPDVLAGKSEEQKKKIAESIAHFLATTGTSHKQTSTASLIAEGEKLFHSIGCVACHNPQNEATKIATSIPLGNLDQKYSLPGLTSFITNPLHNRPSGRMPQFNLAGTEAQSIAAYLLRDVVVDSKINFSYYEGNWEELPDFDTLKAASTGIAAGFETGVGPRKDNFGVVFTGYWPTTTESEYRFRLSSDDGSRLLIDGQVVVDHDGIHGMTSKEGKRVLSAGLHEVRVEYFEAAGGEELKIEVFGGGLNGVGLDSLLRATKAEARKPNSVFQVDAEKAKLGKAFFQSTGCAQCHQLDTNPPLELASYVQPKPVKTLDVSKGCLSDSNNTPRFGLTEYQVECLTKAIKHINRATAPNVVDLEESIHQKLETLNCYACHSRERKDRLIFGGVVDVSGESFEIYERKKWFTGLQAEMGDEGQHPPALKSVGAKLNPQWLDHVLKEGANDRPYMLTRMPKFGSANLGKLAEELIEQDKLTNVPVVTQTEDERKVKSYGRFLAGEDALSCIKCHTFGKYNATGIQSIDMTTMTKRLNKDWFQVYMVKPSKFRRGTRMPESWPGGKSYYPDILDGDTQKQIESLWMFLSEGTEAAKPKGLIRSKMELKPVDSPIVYRNFIEGAGPRAIGVGYPEQINIAFDAQLSRLALVWKENFIDASRHWTGRGQGYEPPLGEHILKLPDGVAFAVSQEGPWNSDTSERVPQFKGYRFDKQRRPVFRYQLNDVFVEDQPIPVVASDPESNQSFSIDEPVLQRKFIFTAKETKKIFLRPADVKGKKIKIKNHIAIVDDRVRLQFNGPATWHLVKDSGNPGLLLEIELSEGSTEVDLIYVW